jgi:hypothetical protein
MNASIYLFKLLTAIYFFLFPAGEICSGHCCDKKIENELVTRSTNNFERLVRHHTRSHRGIWESTASIFRGKCHKFILNL